MVVRQAQRVAKQAKDADDSLVTPQSRRVMSGSSRGFEWSLRNLRKIDTGAQHFLKNYYPSAGDDSDDDSNNADKSRILQENQSAYEIFKGSERTKATRAADSAVWATLHTPLYVQDMHPTSPLSLVRSVSAKACRNALLKVGLSPHLTGLFLLLPWRG